MTFRFTTTLLRQCFAVPKVLPLNLATPHWYTFRMAHGARAPPAVAISASGEHYEERRFNPVRMSWVSI